LSVRKLEKDYKHHVKIKSLIGKSNHPMPIESFVKKRNGVLRYLPPLSEEGSFTSSNRKATSLFKRGEYETMLNLDLQTMQPPPHLNFDTILADDPRLAQYYYETRLNKQNKQLRQRNNQPMITINRGR
jgi:hypothetical protein